MQLLMKSSIKLSRTRLDPLPLSNIMFDVASCHHLLWPAPNNILQRPQTKLHSLSLKNEVSLAVDFL